MSRLLSPFRRQANMSAARRGAACAVMLSCAAAAAAADGCNASGLWLSVGSSDTITVAEAGDSTLLATAASRGFVDAVGRVYAIGTLLYLDCCMAGGIGGVFAGPDSAPCAVISWADGSATHWARAPAAPAAIAPAPSAAARPARAGAIDRRAVVGRYPLLTDVVDGTLLDPADVFTLGNGDFAFNVDATGLQTFNTSFATRGPALDLNTLSSWAFHSTPGINDGTADGRNAALRLFNFTTFPTPTGAHTVRPITLATDNNNSGQFSQWSMSNPHRVGLGQLSFRVLRPSAIADPPEANWETVTNIRAALDTWTGAFTSSFVLAPQQGTDPFCVETGESGAIVLQCAQPNATIATIIFASFGAPLAGCPSPIYNASCTAPNSTAVIESLCLGQNSCSIPSGDSFWGDPCRWTPKRLVVQAHCNSGGGYRSDGIGSGPRDDVLNSTFAVTVNTTVHPDVDLVAMQLTCVRLTGSQACPTALRLALPFADGRWGASANNWDSSLDSQHQTDVVASSASSIELAHYMDDFIQSVRCDWSDATWTMSRTAVHGFTLVPPPDAAAATVQLSCLFAPMGAQYPVGNIGGPSYVAAKAAATLSLLRGASPLPFFEPAVRNAAAAMWASFWSSGSAVDLAGATGGANADAKELERRVVLSQYLTRAHSAGMTPPQETGLLSNSWSGRFHLEMRWWHQAHFPLWGRPDFLDRSHAFYFELLQNATSLATQQGFRGARWQKMLALANRHNRSSAISVPWLGEAAGWRPPSPSDEGGLLLLWESANGINPVLTWNSGPVIWLANAIRIATNASKGEAAAQAMVERLAPLVLATADCIVDMPFFNESSGYFELGPPTLGAEEMGDFMRIRKPVFETVYFASVLDVANDWRELLGLARDAKYDAVASGLGGLPLDPAQSVPTYSFNAEATCCYNATCPPGRFGGRDQCSVQSGHPSPAAVLGLLDGRRFGDRYGVDAAAANATVAAITYSWQWSNGGGWGWVRCRHVVACLRRFARA